MNKIISRNLTNILIILFFTVKVHAQLDTSRVSLLFLGDIMGHDRQLEAAYDSITKTYSFDTCFYFLKSEFEKHDFVVANLEVTLNCKPYSGYPAFSSPVDLPIAAINAGVNVFVTANNHSADRGYKGVVRTNKALDSLKVRHTGTFNTIEDRNKKYPMLLEKNGIRLGLLNYTYGLNGLPVPEGTYINLIDTVQILKDLKIAKSQHLDKIIVFIHWGLEYELEPNKEQIDLANWLFKNGVDIIIGSHPHVVQKSVYQKLNNGKETFVVYSLGNFISNQRTQPRDGGQMIHLEISKVGSKTFISEKGFILTWVYAPIIENKKYFFVLPAAQYEDNKGIEFLKDDFSIMQKCLEINREVLLLNNVQVPEIK